MKRRQFMTRLGRALAGTLALAAGGTAWRRSRGAARTVWQVDPRLCTQCGRCATACVLSPSAVKCVHAYAMCGYCKLCFGFFQPDAPALTESAENQLCPVGAIRRTFVEDPYFEYTIDEPACIGCGLCVKGCSSFGNGSLFLQIRHDRCVNCNDCAIAAACPSRAIRRVPANRPYLLKDELPALVKRTSAMLLALLLALVPAGPAAAQASRFPKPQFETQHAIPSPTTPAAAGLLPAWLDAVVLAAAVAAISWLLLRRRSRRGAMAVSVLSLAWFGFGRRGCTCPVGAVQNLGESLLGSGGVAWLALAFLLVPLVASLIVGRTFCAGVCPLGALQELAIARPLRLPRPLDAALRLIPVAVLGAAVLLAANGGGYIVCRADPFVGFFRLSGPTHLLLSGVAVLLVGLVVARPYCRYVCPLGVILGWGSLLAWRHVTVTPDRCVRCRLCEGVCPVDAIRPPAPALPAAGRRGERLRLVGLVVALPLLLIAAAGAGSRAGTALSHANPTVALAARVATPDPADIPLDVAAFRQLGGSEADLAAASDAIRERFRRGGRWVGLLVALVAWTRLLALLRHAPRPDVVIDREACVSCGRCFSACPQEHQRRRTSATPA